MAFSSLNPTWALAGNPCWLRSPDACPVNGETVARHIVRKPPETQQSGSRAGDRAWDHSGTGPANAAPSGVPSAAPRRSPPTASSA